jgi:hypothetical protein
MLVVNRAPSSPCSQCMATLYCVAGAKIPLCSKPRTHPPRALVPVRSLDCYDPALVALLHASPIASRWRRRPILARRNLIRQAAPPGPSARGSPKSRKSLNQTKRPLPAASPPRGSALLLLLLFLLPTLSCSLYHPPPTRNYSYYYYYLPLTTCLLPFNHQRISASSHFIFFALQI